MKRCLKFSTPFQNSIKNAMNIENIYSAHIYLFKVNNRNTRKRCETCSKLTIKKPETGRAGVFIVNFEHISHYFLFLLLTLNK